MKYGIEQTASGYPIITFEGTRAGTPTAPELEFWGEIQRLRQKNKQLLEQLSPRPTAEDVHQTTFHFVTSSNK